MKKVVSIVILTILFLSGVNGFAISNDTVTKQKCISIPFSSPSIQQKSQFLCLDINEANSYLSQPGKPLLPSYIHTFTFPITTKIENIICTPSEIKQWNLSKKIMPSPEAVFAGSGFIREKTQVSYEKDSYPNRWYDYDIGCGIKNNHQCILVKIKLLPIQYYTSKDFIQFANAFDITIEYTTSNQQQDNADTAYDFIILTPSEFVEELDPLSTHKNNRDISTNIVSLDEIYNGTYFPTNGRDDQEKIKYFIKNTYDQWNTRYVLLVGGADRFPVRMSHVNVKDWDEGSFASDLYYADIYDEHKSFCSWDSNGNGIFGEIGFSELNDSVDIYPDVHLGRLACINSEEVSTCVNKIIDFEQKISYTSDWFSTIGAIGGDTHIGDSEQIAEGEYINEVILELMNEYLPVRLYASNGGLSGYFPTGVQKITTMFNDGCGFVNFIGHGLTWGYGTHPHTDGDKWLPTPDGYYLTKDVNNLENNDKLPIVITSGCDVGKFYEDENCFSWAFLSNPKGGGIASFGASAVSYGGGGTDSATLRIGKMIVNMYDAFINQHIETIGEMWTAAVTNYLHPAMTLYDYKVVESWQAFADPTLQISSPSQPPAKPQILSGERNGSIGNEYVYSAVTTDPENDTLFYRWNWGNQITSDWIGPMNSGKICETSHTWDEKGSYKVTVQAKDEHGNIGEWSDPLSVSMPKTKKIFEFPIINNFFQKYLQIFQFLESIFE